MVKHLRYFHCKIQALCGLEADVTHGTITQAAAETHAATQVTQSVDVRDGRQAAGFTAALEREQRPAAVATPPDRRPQAVQWVAEEAGQQDRSAKVSEGTGKRTSRQSRTVSFIEMILVANGKNPTLALLYLLHVSEILS